VPRPFPLRTLLHVADDGRASLLSQVYLGALANAGNPIGLCTREAGLKQDAKATALRMGAAHLPLNRVIDDTSPGTNTGTVALGSTLVRTITVPFNDPSNPFVHQYHPDHYNRDARPDGTNTALAEGVESYTVTRTCSFTFTTSPPEGVSSAGWGSSVIGGQYSEVIRGLHKDVLTGTGTFILRRASEIGTLTVNH
jgi:hypothetical protein